MNYVEDVINTSSRRLRILRPAIELPPDETLGNVGLTDLPISSGKLSPASRLTAILRCLTCADLL